jgi:hypothetical protein
LLSSLREHLQLGPEQRARERYSFDHPLRVLPVMANSRLGEALECHTKDVSLGGMGILARAAPPSQKVYLHPALPHRPEAAVLAEIVRIERRADGKVELGAAFRRFAGRR